LAELHERGSKLLECEPCALLHFEMRDFSGSPPLEYVSCMFEQRSESGATHEIPEPMPHKNHTDLAQARQLSGPAERPGDH
jgi:hypothetical protein